MTIPSRRGPLFLVFLLLAAGCAPTSTTVQQEQGASAGVSSAPKTLRIGLDLSHEPKEGFMIFGGGGVGGTEHSLMFHAGLTIYDADGELRPRLARKVPTIEDGDWRVLADGTMEVTWKLRPDARWHDGTRLTADDFALGMQILLDPELPARRARGANLIARTFALDPETLIMVWKQPYMLANAIGIEQGPAVASHLMAELYGQADKQTLINSSYWARDFIGLGPYRLASWELGSHIEALAVDQYLFGRPKIDRLILRYFGSPNTLVANLLSGDVDIAPLGSSLDASHLVTVKQAWDPADVGTATAMPRGVRDIYLQFRDPNAPWARDVRVRRAFAHMTDREVFVEALQFGLTTPAHTNITREDPAYRLLEQRGLPTYPYDMARAERLLADAGWTRGADRGFQNSAGQRLGIEVAGTNRGDAPKEIEALAGQWAGAGLQTTAAQVNAGAANYEELRANVKGTFLFNWTIRPDAAESTTTAQVASEATRWRGSNFSGYSNPAFDRLYDQYTLTLELGRRHEALAEVMRLGAEDVSTIPIYYLTSPLIFRKGIRGPGMAPPVQLASAWNIHTWEMD